MDLGDLITPEGVNPSLRAQSKKQLLQEIALHASKLTNLDQRKIFDTLLQRERLGSTGIGQGIAIPHGKLPNLESIICIFVRLDQPIEFDSIDDQPVDLIFLLLAPEGAGADHLKALARISRLLREPAAIEKLRTSENSSSLFAVLTEPVASHHAA